MIMSTYSEKLKDPRWQKRRLGILNLHEFTCEKCGSKDKELHVHHRFYIKGREVWEYDNDVFQVLCVDCHENVHKKEVIKPDTFPEKYESIIGLLDFMDKRNEKNLSYLELLLETVSADEISLDETFSLIDLCKAYCSSEFGYVLKYLIRDHLFREENESTVWEEINKLKDSVKILKTAQNG